MHFSMRFSRLITTIYVMTARKVWPVAKNITLNYHKPDFPGLLG
jgi:hypothetical protein